MRCIKRVPLDWAALLLLVAIPAFALPFSTISTTLVAQGKQQEDDKQARNRALEKRRQIAEETRLRELLQAGIAQQQALQNLKHVRLDQNAIVDPTVEQLVFGRDGGRKMALEQLEILQEREIDDLTRTCNLSMAQKSKVALLCRGDVKRFFDQVEILMNRQAAKESNATIEPDARRLYVQYSSGLFHERSLLFRTLPTVLDATQLAKHEADLTAHKRVVHNRAIKQVVTLLGRRASLTNAERQKLTAFLLRETKPPTVSFGYDHYYLLIQLGNLEEAKLKTQFSDQQLGPVREFIKGANALKSAMHMFGYFDEAGNDT